MTATDKLAGWRSLAVLIFLVLVCVYVAVSIVVKSSNAVNMARTSAALERIADDLERIA